MPPAPSQEVMLAFCPSDFYAKTKKDLFWHTSHKRSRVKVFFLKEGRIKKSIQTYAQPLAHFMEDPQFYGIVRAVDDVADGGLGNAAFPIQLILRHLLFGQQIAKASADRLIQFQSCSPSLSLY